MKKFLLLVIIALISSFALLWVNIDVNPERVTTIFASSAFYDVNDKLFHVRLSPASEWQITIPLNEMVNAEDGRFYNHMGIDILALLRAIYQDITRAHIVSGASTITSQVIRHKACYF